MKLVNVHYHKVSTGPDGGKSEQWTVRVVFCDGDSHNVGDYDTQDRAAEIGGALAYMMCKLLVETHE